MNDPAGDEPRVGAAGPAPARDRFATYVLPDIDVLLRVARTVTPHHADAEDLVQETLIHAKHSLARHGHDVPGDALDRLRAFGEHLLDSPRPGADDEPHEDAGG